MPKFTSLTDNDGCVSDMIETNTCKGGCGERVGKCCKPDQTEYALHTFTCTDSETGASHKKMADVGHNFIIHWNLNGTNYYMSDIATYTN